MANQLIIKGKSLFPHGRKFTATVINAKAHKTATVEWYWKRYVPKYERYEQKRTRIKAHNEVNAEKGDKVVVQECRPISKTKNFVIIETIGKNIEFLEREEGMEAGKMRKEKEEISEGETKEEKSKDEGKSEEKKE